jgi:hypothetical protein
MNKKMNKKMDEWAMQFWKVKEYILTLEMLNPLQKEVTCKQCKRNVFYTDQECWWCGTKEPGKRF